jgi:dehydrogenase/reductase SDR family member 12
MIPLYEAIEIARPIEACFRYVADFRNTLEWDPTVLAAGKNTPGPVTRGTQFALVCKAGPSKLSLTYEVIEYTPWQCLVLVGTCRWFSVRDTITFEPRENGATRIHYRAEFQYRFGLEAIARRQVAALQEMGGTSIARLAVALEDENPAPITHKDTECKDRRLTSALACFTRFGYLRGRQRWLPMSTDMTGKHVVLTGASSGLGFATAVALLEANANLTLVIRDATKVDSMQTSLEHQTGRRAGHVKLADLSLLSEVEALSASLLARGEPIDVLINNAGALFNHFGVTSEGLEQSIALLLLSPWRLTERLHPLLKDHSATARVINVVSGGMYTQKLSCSTLTMSCDQYKGSVAYARAKRALAVLTEQWAERWQPDNIAINSMHPGWADTPGVQDALPLFRRITRRVLRNAEEGADTIVWLARAREADQVSGKLFLDREPRPTHLRKTTIETPEERRQLTVWLEKTFAELSLTQET